MIILIYIYFSLWAEWLGWWRCRCWWRQRRTFRYLINNQFRRRGAGTLVKTDDVVPTNLIYLKRARVRRRWLKAIFILACCRVQWDGGQSGERWRINSIIVTPTQTCVRLTVLVFDLFSRGKIYFEKLINATPRSCIIASNHRLHCTHLMADRVYALHNLVYVHEYTHTIIKLLITTYMCVWVCVRGEF